MSEIAILVPVLGRPQKAAPLAENIAAATTVPHFVVWVCSANDEAQILACIDAEGYVLIADWEPGHADYAKKIQLGYRQTSCPFVFTGADDLVFQPGWAEAALEVAEATVAGVIGTDDRRNALVMRGGHSTHSLVRRSYIEELGGTFDRTPGQVLSEAYSHQWVDTELCAVARARGLWAFAADSHVIHEHPFWNRREGMDATYEKALKHGREDGRLFQRRQREFARARKVRA